VGDKDTWMQNITSLASKLGVEFGTKKFITLVEGSAFFNVQKLYVQLIMDEQGACRGFYIYTHHTHRMLPVEKSDKKVL